MQVNELNTNGARYACIATDTRTLDVHIPAGVTMAEGLRNQVADWRKQAARLLSMAADAEGAAAIVELRASLISKGA